jgi:hypothetical protein
VVGYARELCGDEAYLPRPLQPPVLDRTPALLDDEDDNGALSLGRYRHVRAAMFISWRQQGSMITNVNACA